MVMEKLRYPIGEQNFEEIRRHNKLYVDKTALVYELVDGNKYYFLCRPRRFGKSLLVSTLEAYFLGKRDLFKGLAIDSLSDDWASHPVLHIDMAATHVDSVERLEKILNLNLTQWERLYGADPAEDGLSERFGGVIRRAYEKTGRRVVVLVDEYDKPILDTMHDTSLNESIRNTLAAVYANLKTMDPYIRFGFLTGVTRFNKVSIFSSLNNLKDISLSDEFAAICGITPDELRRHMQSGIARFAQKRDLSQEEVIEMLRVNYDGYHFSQNGPDIYNPFSLFNALEDCKIDHYWSATGTPTFLVKLLRERGLELRRLQDEDCRDLSLRNTDISVDNPVALMFQTGYLTIRGYDSDLKAYRLGYPNLEVKEAFLEFLYPYYINGTGMAGDFSVISFIYDVRTGETDSFMNRLRSLFAKYPYETLKTENHPDGSFDCERLYHNVIYLIFTLMGFTASIETHCSTGISDMEVETAERIYIFEFKYNRSAREALDQINKKGYAMKYGCSKKKIIKIGVNFSSAERTISDWIIETEQ